MSPRRIWSYGIANFAHEVAGANWIRLTKTWSPTSRVFSIELEGIANACTMKVMMKRPVASTPAREARNSTLLSFGLASFLASPFLLRRFVILLHPAIVSLNCEVIGETRWDENAGLRRDGIGSAGSST